MQGKAGFQQSESRDVSSWTHHIAEDYVMDLVSGRTGRLQHRLYDRGGQGLGRDCAQPPADFPDGRAQCGDHQRVPLRSIHDDIIRFNWFSIPSASRTIWSNSSATLGTL
ncbi:hypothetical protein GCM10025857_13560 [Alicyclobacillus contaminans]|nr:hypothetical protein GCM10025857_13560 [Alicyclobacillus contaminans]